MVSYQYHYKEEQLPNTMALEILRKIGLSPGEIKVYSALLDLGSAPVNHIHEKIGIERRNIYDILNKLIEKGLVTYTEENKKRTFQITNPNKLISYIEEKKKELELTKNTLSREIPALISRFDTKKQKINADTFRGPEGIKAVWEDMLNYDATYWIGSGRYVLKKFPNFFIPWNKRRIQKSVKWFNLLRYEMKKTIKIMPLEYVKFLPKEFSGNPTVIGIYGDKVAQFIFGEALFAFVITSKELAENYKAYHTYLWKQAKN